MWFKNKIQHVLSQKLFFEPQNLKFYNQTTKALKKYNLKEDIHY